MMTSEARPAQPKSILRGHKAQIHAAAFIRHNERLVTGDAEGFVIVWDLTIMRPRAVWRPHTNAILGIQGWGPDKIITHGRDNKLIVWKLGLDGEARMSTALPLDPSTASRPGPWMLHMLDVNTMNFCSFSSCPFLQGLGDRGSEILVAVPNTLASEAIDIYHLPSQARRYTVKLGDKNGMVMALSISSSDSNITLVAGYENGIAIAAEFRPETGEWKPKYQSKTHNQPILSLDISPERDFFITSGADAIIAKHPIPIQARPSEARGATSNTLRATQSSSSKTANENPPVSLLSAALQQETQSANTPQVRTTSSTQVQTEPLKVVNTKHAGQQGLQIRSDGRVFATAGWDNKVRVYSAKTLKEVAVLKWHQAGCYAVAFAEINPPKDEDSKHTPVGSESGATEWGDKEDAKEEAGSLTVIPRLVELTVREKRIEEVRSAHWLVAGSKDSKISLWDIF